MTSLPGRLRVGVVAEAAVLGWAWRRPLPRGCGAGEDGERAAGAQGPRRDCELHGHHRHGRHDSLCNVPVPLCEKGKADREAVINALPLTDVIGPLVDHQAAASLKEGVAKEASDIAAIAAAATTSGRNIPKRGRKFSSVLGNRRKAPTPSASDASPPPQRLQRLVTLGEMVARA